MLSTFVKKAIQDITKTDRVPLMTPKYPKFGDFSVNIKALQGQGYDMSTDDLAGELSTNPLFQKVSVVGAFVNMFVNTGVLGKEIARILKTPANTSKNTSLEGKKYMVEFAHPNTHKVFHIGHLRNITIGESLVRILQASGANVIRANYQGDVGLHIAKCLYQLIESGVDLSSVTSMDERVALLGKSYAEGNAAYESSDEAKEKIHELNKKIYQKDPDIIDLYNTTRQWSLDYFETIYQRVGTTFDRYYFESEVADRGLEIAKQAVADGILVEDDGAIILNGEEHGVDTRVFVNQIGLPTYEGKDLGLAELEFTEHGTIDRCIHVVGPEQAGYFKTLFKALELINPDMYKGKEHHFAYGFVDLKDGKMSSRKGNVLSGKELLDTVQDKVKETFDLSGEAANVVAVGAVKYAFLKVEARKNIAFDINESISTQGNSGPYLQYAYARIQSLIKDAEVSSSVTKSVIEKLTEEDMLLLRKLPRFPEAVLEASESYSPHVICTYLFELAQQFSTLYEKRSISKEEDADIKSARIAIVAATGNILKEGLSLLGIQVLDTL